MEYFKGISRIDPESFGLALGLAEPVEPEAPQRGTASEVVRQLGAGLVVDAPQMLGKAVQYFAPEQVYALTPEEVGQQAKPTPLQRLGAGIEAYGAEGQEEWAPDMRGRNVVQRSLISGARGIGAMLPTLAATAVNPAVGLSATAAYFGGSAGQDTYEKVLAETGDREAASAAAIRVAGAQGLGETAAAYTGSKFIGLLGRGAGATTSKVAEKLTTGGGLKEFAKGYATNLVVQPTTEVAQDLATEFIERAYGATPSEIAEIAQSSAEGGFGMALLLGPLGGANSFVRAKQSEKLRADLESEDPATQKLAVDFVSKVARAQGVSQEDVSTWVNTRFAEEEQAQQEETQANLDNPQEVDLTVEGVEKRKVAPLPDLAYAPRGTQGTLVGLSQQPDVLSAQEETDLLAATSAVEAQETETDKARRADMEAEKLLAEARAYDEQAIPLEAAGDEASATEAQRLRNLAAGVRSRIPATEQVQTTEFETRLTAGLLKESGLTPRSSYYRQLLGKDMADPAQKQSIGVLFTRLLDDPKITQSTKDAVSRLQMQAFGGLAQQREMIGARGGPKPAGQASTQQQATPEQIQDRNTLPTAPMGRVAPDVADVAAQEVAPSATTPAPVVEDTAASDAQIQTLLDQPDALSTAERRQIKQLNATLELAQTEGERQSLRAIRQRVADAASARLPAVEPVSPSVPAGAVTPAADNAAGDLFVETETDTALTAEADVADAEPETPITDKEAAAQDAEIQAILASLDNDAPTAGTRVLNAVIKSDVKKAPGRPSYPKQVYAAIRNVIINPKSKPVVRQEGKAATDVAATEKYGAKVAQIAKAATEFANAYERFSNLNLVRTDEKIKRGTEESKPEARVKNAESAAVQVRVALARLGEAVGGNAKDVETIVRFVKDRAQKERRSDPVAAKADITLSRAWAAAKRESFLAQIDFLDVSNKDTRQSKEAAAKGATPQLVTAATEGWATFGNGTEQDGVLGVMNYLRQVGTPYEKMLATATKIALKNKNIKIEFAEGKSQYNPKTRTITISSTASKEVVLHEALHGALQEFVYKNPAAKEVKNLVAAARRVAAYDTKTLGPKAADVQKVIKNLLDKGNDLDAALELVSYGNTLNDFRRALQGIESSTPNLFRTWANDVIQMVEAVVVRFLGGKRSLATDVMQNTFSLLDQAAGVETTGKGAGNILKITGRSSEAFARWFGKSVVRDQDGAPAVLYHGTNADIVKFDLDHPDRKDTGWLGTGVYLTDSEFVAGEYASQKVRRGGGNKVLMPLYARIEKPYYATVEDKDRIRRGGRKAADAFSSFLTENGYDGVILEYDGGGSEYVVFDPAGVKSSIGNNGEYDATNANILKAEVQSAKEEVPEDTGGFPSLGAYKDKPGSALNLTRSIFEFAGFGAGGTREAQAKRAADNSVKFIRKNLPGLEKYIRGINSKFGFSEGLKKIADYFKQESQTSLLEAERLAHYMYKNPAQAERIWAYLDGDKNALTNKGDDVSLRLIADNLNVHINKYIASLPASDRKLFEGRRLSEILLTPSQINEVAKKAFGIDKVGKLFKTERRQETSLDAFKDYLSFTNGVLDSSEPMYQVMENIETADGVLQKVPYGFISKSKLGQFPGLDVDQSRVWFLDKSTRATGKSFNFISRAANPIDVRKMAKSLQDKTVPLAAREEVLTQMTSALMNTVAGLSKNFAAKNYVESLDTFGDENGAKTASSVVFNSIDEVNSVFEGRDLTEGKIIDASKPESKITSIRDEAMRDGVWVRLPNEGYGVLNGKLLSGPVWSNLLDMNDRSPLFNSAGLATLMTTFKKSKTIFTPATHANNILTNYSMMLLHGISHRTVADAAVMFSKFEVSPESLTKEQRAIMKAFYSSGAVLGQFTNSEAKRFIADSLAKQIRPDANASMLTRLAALGRHEKAMSDFAIKALRAGKATDSFMTELYAAGDNVFRLAAFMNVAGNLQEKNGKLGDAELQEAGLAARKMFLDYDIDARMVRTARQSFLPFVSWAYAITPVLGRLAITRPWAMVNMMGAISLMGAMIGDDDDEMRRMGPEQVRESSLYGLGPYKYMRVPFMGDDENPVYFNLGKSVPIMSLLDPSPSKTRLFDLDWLPGAINPNGPYIALTTIMLQGKDPFTGKDLYNISDDNWDKVLKGSAAVWNELTPSLTRIGGINKPTGMQLDLWGKGADYMSGATGPTGKAKDALFMARFFGLSVYEFNKDEARFYNSMAAKKIKREFKAEINRYKREFARRGYDDYEELDSRLQGLYAQMYEEMRKAVGEEE